MIDIRKISSPCVDNCCLDGEDICLGCYRHVNEITEWGDASNQRRLEIIKRAKTRRLKRNQRD